ncbi:MAG TPA: vitamin K epoxide reductase family protein [Acidobacteriaceae bacterium]|nr:vitamin K epoxide reductase family protein [Acidobacteriaceae bacterium]
MRPADRAIALAGCCTALGALVPVALFQSELTDTLPDPPGEIFASERITLSETAHPLGIPDSYLGLASYGATLTLLLLSDKSRVARRLLGFKLIGDAGAAGFNAVRQVAVFGKLCSWCTLTAVATIAMAYGGRQAMGEAARTAGKAVSKR